MILDASTSVILLNTFFHQKKETEDCNKLNLLHRNELNALESSFNFFRNIHVGVFFLLFHIVHSETFPRIFPRVTGDISLHSKLYQIPCCSRISNDRRETIRLHLVRSMLQNKSFV